MRRVVSLVVQAAILFAAFASATFRSSLPALSAVRSHIDCNRTTITKLRLPTGPYGADSGYATFANKHSVTLIGFEPDHWRSLREGDHVMVCVNSQGTGCRHDIDVIDFDGDIMFDSFQGPAGTCP